jgi:hypothetical protein
MKVDISGAKVTWLRICWLHYGKAVLNETHEVQFKYLCTNTEFRRISLIGKPLRGRGSTVPNMTSLSLEARYDERLPVSKQKKNDLGSLCRTGIIPAVYHSYYDNLPVASVCDRLSTADCDEEYYE